MAILDTLSCIAPEFDALAETIRTCIIGLAENQVSESVFGVDYEAAVAYLAAHMLTLRQRNDGNGGAVTLKREGDLQLQYAIPSANITAGLYLTAYGVEFLRIRNLHVTGVLCAS